MLGEGYQGSWVHIIHAGVQSPAQCKGYPGNKTNTFEDRISKTIREYQGSLSVLDFASQLWENDFLQSCETKSGMESLGSMLAYVRVYDSGSRQLRRLIQLNEQRNDLLIIKLTQLERRLCRQPRSQVTQQEDN